MNQNNSSDLHKYPLQSGDKPRQDQWPDDTLTILPLRNAVFFPLTLGPLNFGREVSVLAVEEALRLERQVGVICQRDPSIDSPQPVDLYSIGTAADVLSMVSVNNGRQALVQGTRRFRVVNYVQLKPYLVARVIFVPDEVPATKDFEARVLHLRHEMQHALTLLPAPSREALAVVQSLHDPSGLVDFVASWLDLPIVEKQEILETFDLEARL